MAWAMSSRASAVTRSVSTRPKLIGSDGTGRLPQHSAKITGKIRAHPGRDGDVEESDGAQVDSNLLHAVSGGLENILDLVGEHAKAAGQCRFAHPQGRLRRVEIILCTYSIASWAMMLSGMHCPVLWLMLWRIYSGVSSRRRASMPCARRLATSSRQMRLSQLGKAGFCRAA